MACGPRAARGGLKLKSLKPRGWACSAGVGGRGAARRKPLKLARRKKRCSELIRRGRKAWAVISSGARCDAVLCCPSRRESWCFLAFGQRTSLYLVERGRLYPQLPIHPSILGRHEVRRKRCWDYHFFSGLSLNLVGKLHPFLLCLRR